VNRYLAWAPYWVGGFIAGWLIAASSPRTPRLPEWVAYVVVLVVCSGVAEWVARRTSERLTRHSNRVG
jgi:hypothetical protein